MLKEKELIVELDMNLKFLLNIYFMAMTKLFKFSSVMMRLNWLLPRDHTMKLIHCKYANTFFSILVDI